MNYSNKESNYNIPLEYAKNIFKTSNPEKMAVFSNSYYDKHKNQFKIKCMNKEVYVKYPSGDIYYENDCKINDINLEILIIRFLINANPVKETKKYITFKEIEGGYVYYPAFLKNNINKLISMFGENIDRFDNIMNKIGATKLNLGDSSYKIQFINDTYVVYVIWEGDDEMKPSGNILFDSNIKYYFNAEDIAVVGNMPFIRIYEEMKKCNID